MSNPTPTETPQDSHPQPKQKDTSKKPSKRRRPNHAQLHSNPLPLTIHPLPAFHPSNPLSLLRLIYTYLSSILWPPVSIEVVFTGVFHPATHSVHVTDPRAARALWEQGFFGKGSLSRSEATWLERERAKFRRERVGAEEATAARRDARRLFKLERARVEREKIERQRLIEEGKLDVVAADPDANADADGDLPVGQDLLAEQLDLQDDSKLASEAGNGTGSSPTALQKTEIGGASLKEAKQTPNDALAGDFEHDEPAVLDQEHLQLTPEEAFFLSWGLGALSIKLEPDSTTKQAASELLQLFCRFSTFPPAPEPRLQKPDDQFMLNYVVYHHFRSLGWVVRSGIKFGVDYLLYNRGPVFSHAEFAILIMPAYSHPEWNSPQGLERRRVKQQRDWWWMHCVNRVQSHVLKTTVLCYVEIPPELGRLDDVAAIMRKYKVREFVVKRWVPNRSRD